MFGEKTKDAQGALQPRVKKEKHQEPGLVIAIPNPRGNDIFLCPLD